MSGVKDAVVSLRESEKNRLMSNLRRTDTMESNMRHNMEQAAGRLRGEFGQQMSNLSRRHDRMESAIGQMSGDMQRMERDNLQRLRGLQSNFEQGLNAQRQEYLQGLDDLNRRTQASLQSQRAELKQDIHHLAEQTEANFRAQREEYLQGLQQQRGEYLHLIQEQSQRFAEALEQQREHLQSQISHIEQRLQQEKVSKQERAQQWANNTRLLLDGINEHYRHEKFAPGELRKLQDELRLVATNLSNGDFEAAISASQQTYLRAGELQLNLALKETEWQAWLDTAKQSAAEVLAACDTHKLAEYVFETEEGETAIEAEVDYWTDNKLSALRAQVETEQQRLSSTDDLSVDDFQQSHTQSAEQRAQVEALVEEAQDALLASQLRNNLGQSIEAALQEAGWETIDATYEGEDNRRAVHLKLKNMAGDEMVSIITPEPSEEGIRNRLQLHFFDNFTNDEKQRIQQARNVVEVLREEGLECGDPSYAPGSEKAPSAERERLDFAKLKKKQSA